MKFNNLSFYYSKLAGFSEIKENDGFITAKRTPWSTQGVSLKERREKQLASASTANPWAGKSANDAEMVDEDDLLKEEGKLSSTNFCSLFFRSFIDLQ